MFFAKLRIEIEYSAGHADLPFFICENGAKNVIFHADLPFFICENGAKNVIFVSRIRKNGDNK